MRRSTEWRRRFRGCRGRVRLGAAVLALAAWAAVPAHAQERAQEAQQEAQEDDGVLRVDTQLVLVDVVVRDSDGPVEGLSAEDFTVLDRGREQQISVFEVTSSEPETEALGTLPEGIASNRRDWRGALPTSATVILMDRLNTPTDAQVFANARLAEFLDSSEQLGGVALYELRTDGLRVLHDFTADPKALIEAAKTLEPEHSITLAGSDSSGGFESDLRSVGLDRELSEDFSRGNTGFQRLSSDYFLNERMLRTSAALEAIVGRLEGLKGRKNIVWLSGRFPFTFNIWTRADLAQEVETSTMRQVEEVGIRITEANVAIYPVDIRGPEAEGTDVGSVVETISRTTGARSFRTNDVGTAIASAIGDARVVYTLGFYPSEVTTDGSFREIRVEVAGRGLEVRHRPGYYGFGGDARTAPRVGLAEVLGNALDATSIGLTGTAVPIEDGSGRYEMVTVVDVEDLKLVPVSGRMLGVIDVAMFFRDDDDGNLYFVPATSHSVNLSDAQYQRARTTGFVIQKIVDTEGRTGTLRIAVQDQATGAAGSLWVPAGPQ